MAPVCVRFVVLALALAPLAGSHGSHDSHTGEDDDSHDHRDSAGCTAHDFADSAEPAGFWGSELQEKQAVIAAAVRTILGAIGEDPDREGLVKTPMRVAKALLANTAGYDSRGTTVESLVNQALFNESHHEIVVVKDIEIFSMCEHHMLPFFGRAHIGYIPNGTVVGLSKLARVAQHFARRLQVQERLTDQIAAVSS